MKFSHVHDDHGAGALTDQLDKASAIALDCEAAGFHRYSDRLCLVQVTTDQGTHVVDPFTTDASALFRPVLEDPSVEIVMHGSDFDLRLLSRDLGIHLNGLYDTQIAASLLGLDGLGLAALLEKRFDVRLSKKYQRADWADRPLTDGMLEYAAADTHYLFPLSDQLKEEAEAAGRSSWVEEECRALEENAIQTDDDAEPVDPVTRIKGARSLSPRQITALRVALEWRDEIAREKDRAPFRVIGNPPLIEAVSLAPRRVEELLDIKGFPRSLARAEGKDLLKRLHAVGELPEDQLQGYPRRSGGGPGRPTPEMEALFDRLKAVRNRRADEIGLPRGTLLSNAVLLEMTRVLPQDADAMADVSGMRRWKMGVVGDDLLEVVRKG